MPSRRLRRTAVLAAGCTLAGLAITQSTAAEASASTSGRLRPFGHHSLGVFGTYALAPRRSAALTPVVGPVAPRVTPTPSVSPAVAAPTGVVATAPSTAPAVKPSPTTAPAVAPTTAPVPAVDPTALPVGNLTGWRQVLAEDFKGSTLPAGWGAYEGHPGGEPDGWWSPSHVTVSNGAMHLLGYKDNGRWTTGGVMNSHAAELTYGKYEVRFRMAKGTGVKYAILLWPKSENWPIDGEIDFAEDGGGNRSHTSATMHYGADNSQIQRELTGQDFSQWHTVGVEWTAGKIVYTLDGKPWGSVVSSNVPRGPMDLAIQTETGTCGDQWLTCPDATTPANVNLDVDWVAAWAKS